MAIVRVQQRGQLTLPSTIREQAGLTEGDELLCYINETGEIVLQPLPRPTSVWELVGTARPVRPLDMQDARRKAAAERTRRRLTRPGETDQVVTEAGPVLGEEP